VSPDPVRSRARLLRSMNAPHEFAQSFERTLRTTWFSVATYSLAMECSCVECGCVGRGDIRVAACSDPSCCCSATPVNALDDIARRVRSAFESGDVQAFSAMLAPNAQWGAPEQKVPTCQNRQQILEWYQLAYDAGARATVTDVEMHGGNLVIGLQVTGAPRAKKKDQVQVRWQVLGVKDDLVTSICGYQRKGDAVASATSGRTGWTS
jgi:hypothetical protein